MPSVAGPGVAPGLGDYAPVALITQSVGLYLHPDYQISEVRNLGLLAYSLYGLSPYLMMEVASVLSFVSPVGGLMISPI